MSEILDALKRSEAARLGEEAAKPMPAPVWHASKPRPVWPWLAVLGVSGVVLAGLWQNRSELWPERYPPTAEPELATSKGESPAEPPSQTAPPAQAEKPAHLRDPASNVSASVPVDPVAPNIQPDPAAPPYVAELAPIPAPTAVPPPAAPEANSAAPAEPEANSAAPAEPANEPPPMPAVAATQVPAPSSGSRPGEPPETALPVPTEPVPPADPGLAPAPGTPPQAPNQPAVAVDPMNTTVDPLAQATAAPAASANPDDLLPRYEDLPYTLRHDLPPVKFSLHRYAEDPNQRFVVYKERRISDNGVLGQDLWLKRVLPDGAVLEFRGTEFRVGRD